MIKKSVAIFNKYSIDNSTIKVNSIDELIDIIHSQQNFGISFMQAVQDGIQFVYNDNEYKIFVNGEGIVSSDFSYLGKVSLMNSRSIYKEVEKATVINAVLDGIKMNNPADNYVVRDSMKWFRNATVTTKIMATVLLIAGVGLGILYVERAPIEIVKSLNYKDDTTYGKIISKYIDDAEWRYFESDKSDPVVEVKGVSIENDDIVIQFVSDSSYDSYDYELCYFGVNGQSVNKEQAMELIYNKVILKKNYSNNIINDESDDVDSSEAVEETEEVTEIEKSEMEEITEEIIETAGYDSVIASTSGTKMFCSYFYYDLDKDGIEELILGSGDSDADFYNEVYTMDEKGSVSSVGGFYGMNEYYVAEDGNGIYAVYGHMDYEMVSRIVLNNGKIFESLLWEKTLSEGQDYFSNSRPIQVYDLEGASQPTGENTNSDSFNVYLINDSDTRIITETELTGFTKELCKVARNEIYARKGRMFNDPELQEYFNMMPWYVGYIAPEDFDESCLSDIEKKNINTIMEYERKNGWR